MSIGVCDYRDLNGLIEALKSSSPECVLKTNLPGMQNSIYIATEFCKESLVHTTLVSCSKPNVLFKKDIALFCIRSDLRDWFLLQVYY